MRTVVTTTILYVGVSRLRGREGGRGWREGATVTRHVTNMRTVVTTTILYVGVSRLRGREGGRELL